MTGGLVGNLIFDIKILDIKLVLTILCGILIIGAIVFYAACAFFTWKFFRVTENSPHNFDQPVAILVPIKGVDAGAWKNWASLCEQDYPNYRVYFGAMDPSDPAVSIAQAIVEKYPGRASLTTGLPSRGPNHKDSNVSYLLEQLQAEHPETEWVIFTDSDIYVEPDYIRRVTAPLHRPKVGMVTCSYIARNPRYLGAALASLTRCCDFTPSVLLAKQLDGGMKLGIGVTMAVKRSALEAAGGIVFNRIGSDYNLGKRIDAAGYTVELSRYVLESDTGNESIAAVFERELRWSRTIRFNKGPIYYTQIFCFGTVFALVLLVLTGFAAWAVGLAVFTFLIRYLQAQITIVMMDAPQLGRWFWLLPLRDGMSFVIWLMGGYGRSIFWRGRQLRIQGDGVITAQENGESWQR